MAEIIPTNVSITYKQINSSFMTLKNKKVKIISIVRMIMYDNDKFVKHPMYLTKIIVVIGQVCKATTATRSQCKKLMKRKMLAQYHFKMHHTYLLFVEFNFCFNHENEWWI